MHPGSRSLPLIVGLVAVLSACEGSAVSDRGDDGGDEQSDEVVVALVNPLTGPFAALGEDVNAGFELYLDEHDGALAGHPVQVLTEDTANDTAVAQEAVATVVDDGAVMIAGFVNSGVAYGVAPAIEDAGVPLVITTAGADDLTQRDASDLVFRLSYTSSQDAMPLGAYACEELGHETMAVVGLDYSFGWEAASGFAMAYEDAGCEVVQELYAPLGTSDWGPFVQQIDTTADAVWAVAPGADGIRLVRTYRDFGVDLPLLAHGSTTDEQILAEQQATAEGTISTLHYSAAIETPENAAFRTAFEEATGRSVSQYSEHGYATAQVLEAALATIEGEVTAAAVAGALGAVEVAAPRGPLRFDEYGQAVYNVYVRRVTEVDGAWVNEVIHTYPEVSQFWTYDPEEFMAGARLAERKGTWAS